jgi:hypothetical protein
MGAAVAQAQRPSAIRGGRDSACSGLRAERIKRERGTVLRCSTPIG